MGRSYSEDLRRRIVAAVAGGLSCRRRHGSCGERDCLIAVRDGIAQSGDIESGAVGADGDVDCRWNGGFISPATGQADEQGPCQDGKRPHQAEV